MNEILWRPTEERIAAAKVTAFRRRVNEELGLDLRNHHDLRRWSVLDRPRFWEAVWRFTAIRASRLWDEVLAPGETMRDDRWFPGARLNFAENLLEAGGAAAEAVVFRGEGGRERRLTFGELRAETGRLARALRGAGVGEGDRVAGFLPNIPEAVIGMLATASLGAVWTSSSPDFGIRGVLDRFGQVAPKVLLTADGQIYNGTKSDSISKVCAILGDLPSVERVVIVPFVDEKPDMGPVRGSVFWDEFVGGHGGSVPEFAQLPFDHPLCIMYSSGTTGLPKCMVHSAGGTLIQHRKEHVLHGDLGKADRLFYFTTSGWMMWNWLVSALASGTAIMLYDGSPLRPEPVLWDFAARERFTAFGTSAKYIAAMEKIGLRPGETHDLEALTSILSTGSPLAPESFDYVYREIKSDVRLSSISGGTDIISCFALGSPVLPVRRGELQCRGLGMDVRVFDDAGCSVEGEKGELVCASSFPSMPTAFWSDPDGEKYRRAYFDRFENVWAHGDYAEITESGGMVIHGRSDAVLNPGGVRIGTAEIYRVVERFDEVVEALAAPQEWKEDVRVVLFLRLKEGVALDGALMKRIRDEIRREASPRHVPAKIIAVAAIPRTISGKITEVAVRETIHGRPVKNADALANPEALEAYRDLPELREE
ncbi:MAG: acetoacetate--CoA ligase [Candidatus Eisenbacteria bacterium]